MPVVITSPITLRFVTSDSAISFAIRAAEYGFWASHAEALMPEGTLLGAHVDGGVRNRPRDYDKGQFKQELYVSIPVAQQIADAFHAFLRSQLGKPYDVEAIAAFVARRDWQDPSAWFCSELQAARSPPAAGSPRRSQPSSTTSPRVTCS